jgi:hypothetical protein
MNSAATPNNSVATIDSKKPNTKQELITANIKLLIEQLEARHSDALTSTASPEARSGMMVDWARLLPRSSVARMRVRSRKC